MKHLTHESTAAGFTMLEAMISASLLVSLVLVVGLASDRASGAFDEGRFNQDLDMTAHRALDEIATSLEAARAQGLTPGSQPDFGSPTLTFQQVVGYDGAPQLGPTQTIRFELEPDELDDGLDNNGNGLVDEGRAVWIEDEGNPGERTKVICRRVRRMLEGEQPNGGDDNGNDLLDEPGLSFEVDTRVVTIRLSLEGLDPRGRLVTKTVETSVRMWN